MPLSVTCCTVGLVQTNCYIVSLPGRKDCAVIDPGDKPERILAACGDREIAGILLTHGHFDHIGGVAGLTRPGLPLYIHPLDAPMLRDADLNASYLLHRPVTADFPWQPLSEEEPAEVAGISFRVLHTPGHTAGSCCLLAEDCLFTGDTLFLNGYGRTDLPTGDEEALWRSLARLKPCLEGRRVLPGHGGTT